MSRYPCLLLVLLPFPDAGLAQQDNNLVYQIFVRSFADTRTDTAPAGAKGEAGDLKGITESLKYLNDGNPGRGNDLEAGILWLMPVFPSASYHGYDITDYQNVDPEYGTLQDLDVLIRAARNVRMRIILDIAFNHTSNNHPWFKQAVNDPSSRFRKFYHFAPDDSSPLPPSWHVASAADGRKIRYLGLFGPAMPDLNMTEPDVHHEVKAIAKFWLARGIGGFRLDAAKHVFGDIFSNIPEPDILRNNAWWREFSDFVYSVNPRAILVGEVLGGKETLRRHSYGLDALLDEPFMHSARWRIASPRSGFLKEWVDFVKSCRDVNRQAHASPESRSRSEPFQPFLFLSSHDESPRLASFLEQMQGSGLQSTVEEAYRVGMYLLTSMGKFPVLYQGDELMQRGFKWNGNPPQQSRAPGDGSGIFDETLREPFPWRKADLNTPQTGWFPPRFDAPNDGISVEEQVSGGSMLDLVRALGKLRAQNPAFANGEVGEILADSAEWMVFEKVSGQSRFLVLVNSSRNGNDYNFHEGWFPRYIGSQLIFWSDGQKKSWKNESAQQKKIDRNVFVPPYGFVLLKQVARR